MNKFNLAYSKIEQKIKSNKRLFKSVKIIALLGSVPCGEKSNQWSDLDVLVVINSTPSGNIPFGHLQTLKNITKEVSSNYSFPISIFPHTIDDFKKYVCFEYLIHYSSGYCTYPNSKALKNIIKQILKSRNVSEKIRKGYCIYHLRHIRFNLLRKYISLNEYNSKDCNTKFLKLLIDKMIKVTDLALNYSDIWPRNKREILEKAKKNLTFDVSILNDALKMRTNWASITDKDAKKFISRGILYLYNIFDLFLGNNIKPTPEENMSLL
ncbi:hypothetical protein COT64_02065 [Candidatus Shapirobacteria bacterium CG09_land_8_20_14_0_10_39_12]|uniref:Polymerase nucleotidyl transferase domain-containing protein n=1 Tax=Candidatus Shapirobacteria bacterium CG09_land_8_20_14_0_10_39_12 TaxID=1974885 RepID=A0A2H0WRJ0_9BACT|nr:MAG: hypothetical protein COT64_02065 [Candidatus Shapirobacteria bacterium CG09_land_8_20_14_0_10_39_12]